ncbi:hypothetical protein EYR41_004787 [Orbilia oligospora]|uniref:Uncharacterized protein n=1 Tax=Orbilia oligospora TaxID=2813651 RepID=A0A8H2DYR5_ORBOL|nr:hypothetical protein TWF128_002305 [Orbilia oligospora]TGJ68696.1 hypothetical protein EYR41_004787 [Orbilia oligospora]
MPQHRREYVADLYSYVPLRRYCSVRVFGPGQYMQQYTLLYQYGFHVQRIPTSTLLSCSKSRGYGFRNFLSPAANPGGIDRHTSSLCNNMGVTTHFQEVKDFGMGSPRIT